MVVINIEYAEYSLNFDCGPLRIHHLFAVGLITEITWVRSLSHI